jgi:hypothetical protein
MPKTGIRQSFELTTRDRYTKVDCEIGLTVNGRELPNMEVLGKALDAAAELVQQKITESYKVVPERVEEVVSVVTPKPGVTPTAPVQVDNTTSPVTPAQPPIPSFGS